jgi:hypothetical protein
MKSFTKKKVTGYNVKNQIVMKTISENKIQQEIVLWYNNNFCLKHHNPRQCIFSVPNDSINAIETKRKVNTGLMAGVSDLIILHNGECLFIEVKTLSRKQSEKQKDFEKIVSFQGFKYYLVRSLEDFKKIISSLK